MSENESKQEAEGWHPTDPHLFTYTGEKVYLFRPTSEMIHLEDIAQALSQICRYGGHTRSHYSVAEHSLLVSRRFNEPELAMAGLLHDAAEAYMGDVISPLKSLLENYEDIYDRFDDAIAAKFGVDYRQQAFYQLVKQADIDVGVMERKCSLLSLRNPGHDLCAICMLDAPRAKAEFLKRFDMLL